MTDLTIPDSRTTGKRAWVAEITGRHAEYGLNRRFARTFRAGGAIHITPHPGIVYEVCCPDLRQRYFAAVRGTELKELGWQEVYGYADDMDANRAHKWVPEYKSRIDPLADDMSDL
jgi:hypothetical protein